MIANEPDQAVAGNVPQFDDRTVLGIVAAYSAAFVVFGLLVDGPAAVAHGLAAILTTRDTLLTDYFGVGGIGAACVNAGLLTLCACLVYYKAGARMTGAAVACLFLVLGFALFGKNLLNVWGIVIGVWLYSRFKGEAFAANINTAFFGIALAPIFSEILFSSSLPFAVSLPLAVLTSLAIGFVLAPAAAQLFKAHMGFSLYNMGFTAGLVGTLVVALYKSYGFVPDPVFIWTTGNNLLLGSFLAAVFASMIAVRFLAGSRGARRDEEGDRHVGPVADRFHRAGRLHEPRTREVLDHYRVESRGYDRAASAGLLDSIEWNPTGEGGILWSDPVLRIGWPALQPLASAKDRQNFTLTQWLADERSKAFSFGH